MTQSFEFYFQFIKKIFVRYLNQTTFKISEQLPCSNNKIIAFNLNLQKCFKNMSIKDNYKSIPMLQIYC